MVEGIVTPGDVEVGLIVNGYLAQRSGNNFFVNSQLLLEGENTITVSVTMVAGGTISDSITVYVDTREVDEWTSVELISRVGVAPFKTTVFA